MLKPILLTVSLAPFLYFSSKDNLFHFHGRKVTLWEHLLHLILGLLLAALFICSYRGIWDLWWKLLLGVFAMGSIDEFVFHRQLPADESDLHAKEHWSLLLYIATCIGFL